MSNFQIVVDTFTSGSKWSKVVASSTPPPKQSKLEKTVPCLGLPSLPLKSLPNLRGINPTIIDIPPKRHIAKILVHVVSIIDSFN